ncbi:N/A [soil metagenome]
MAGGVVLIDISNSQTKVARCQGMAEGIMGGKVCLPTGELTADALREAVSAPVERVIFCSVVPEKSSVVYEAFAGLVEILEVSPAVELGLRIDYPEPGSIGPDRLANAVALAAHYEVPGVVVDFGTAVTFDIVSADGAYIGGVIAPGLEVMTDYMYQRTALLPKIDLTEPAAVVGKTTRDAMMAGAVYGYRGLVKEILEEVRKSVAAPRGRRLRVVATGGYAALISGKIPQIEAVDENLTLEGLRIIGNLNPPRRGGPEGGQTSRTTNKEHE